MRLCLTNVVALVVLQAIAALAQTSARPEPPQRVPVGASSIRGRVIDRVTERPVKGALITLSVLLQSSPTLVSETDDDGQYVFEHIAAGRYRVTASHQDYVTSVFGTAESRNPLDGLVTVENRQAKSDVNFALTIGGRITGRVLRHDGQPLKDARVLAMLQFGDGGFTSLPNSMVRTNVRGEYAFSNLPEGHYQVSVSWSDTLWSETDQPRSAQTASPPRPIYYPGTTRVQELVPVPVARGRTAGNIDIVFPASELLRISGKIIASGSEGAVEAFLLTGPAMQPLAVARDGTFTTPLLRAGRYTLLARARIEETLEAAVTTLELSFDVSDLILGLMPTGTISGRVITDDGSPVSDEMQVAAVLTDDGKELDEYRRDRGEIGPNGAFRVRGVFGQRVMRMVGVTAGWKIARVTVGKTDVTTLSVEPGASIDDVLIVLTRS